MRHVEARAGAYADSVTLMQITAAAQAVAGVESALVAMATELNIGLLARLGMQPPAGAGQADMLVAIVASDAESLAAGLAAVDRALAARPAEASGGSGGAEVPPPRTTLSAARRAGPGLALISVPGQHVLAEAVDALDSGCDVMIFSDNVPVGQEVWLKERAAERGLLLMGPDCGTAIVGGIGLGFSHAVQAGPVGLVAASGTGAQQVICLLDAADCGVSAVLGVGGRDLSAQVGGRSARSALAALDADPKTELIVLLSKPPAAEVAADLRAYATSLATPVQFALIGPGQPDLTEAAEAALRAVGRKVPAWPAWAPAASGSPAVPRADPRGPNLVGLFAGGTLCDEAMVIAAERLGPVYSNIPLQPEWRLEAGTVTGRDAEAGRHIMIDFGDDELTAGRPHPMIDQRLRLERFATDAASPATAVIMLDVVLGHGAHPDPASEVAPAIAAALAARTAFPGPDLRIVVSLIGARSDPQGLAAQASALAEAGAHVFASNAAAANFACDCVGRAVLARGDDPPEPVECAP
jgi:FdrA protein